MSNRSSSNSTFEIYAHRGLPHHATENTHSAFRAALEAGADWLETDVNTTADGQVVVFHDATLNRLCGVPGLVSATTWDELQNLPLVGGGKIPRLIDVLTDFPNTRFNIDLKDDGAADRITEVLKEAGAIDRVRLASFSESRHQRAHRRAQELDITHRTSASQTVFVIFYLASRLHPGLWKHIYRIFGRWVVPFDALQVPHFHRLFGRNFRVVDSKLVQTAHRYGKLLHVWTINDEDEMRYLIALGVDGIVTNRTDILARVLGRTV